MSSARRLLLVAALALAIAADARTEATVSTLTLSPTADSLITTRGGSTKFDTPSTPAVIGSAASDTNKFTQAPATQAPATTAPPTRSESKETEPPATTAPPISSESDSASASDSHEQDAADTPAKVRSSDRSSLDSATQTDATPSASTSSKSTTASVDTLNDSNSGLSTGKASNIAAVVPSVFGALACVGAIIMAVTYKRKRDRSGDDSDNRLSSDCEYTGGADFTPENRTLTTVQEGDTPNAVGIDVVPSSAIVDFTGTDSSVSSTSPFGSTRCKVRVSSPITGYCTNSEPNMEFQDTFPRHEGGSNVVLTFDEVPTESRRGAPQVQL
ncbi:hypothetical protein F441_03105 [Phytophthora nicotianae CJ01A1]|uniref:Uncharacterized protein n=6 Tax=Phytophthora nicotianae TaxID=4792 RepID=W2PCX3_PHYN3|nr:hypothetical protein PPTG_19533 [Phytophthora nicotianae INRA-310]ETI54018.1 hypothetical protein F443_03123 [Phytophthora nicotianae P1569]ETK93872.1 hypothetical protein L915_03005 [Phytophthora nicotianae]ETO82706.1 hypothetical protein F444_03186 [Phytophthora nicotianae P1976]ETP23829.1 hypothetical protein F441_03105 [Phytophthora nicotianae CJ01A1]ETP51817.1 hypothetical protein F442_03102 [Phytophthora nicotianae P10297]KUF77831.1 hypothetical protein AM587_10012192 [Phytophthora n